MQLSHKHRQFVSFVKEHLSENNVKLVVGRGRKVNAGGFLCDGYFDEYQKIIKVAKNDPYFLETLLHEYCHYLQWIHKTKIFKRSDKYCTIVEQWLNGKHYSKNTVKRAFYWVRKMERECEQLAAKLIDKYELPIDKERYIKNANCYIYAHYFMEIKRKYTAFKKNPFKNRKVQQVMPKNFKALSHQTIPKKVYKALLSCV
jgi:Zn-dependent peptidase ImmA (M78 family)